MEREPVALWQYQGKQVLIDDNGVVMDGVMSASYPNLPLIVGADAPARTQEIISLLASQPKLAKQFESAIRVSARRWNIRFKGGMEVKLPEKDPQQAWNALAEIEEKQQLLARQVHVIDLRVAGRLFIKLSPEHAPAVDAAGAKET
jgi:cell division protein FtsQ